MVVHVKEENGMEIFLENVMNIYGYADFFVVALYQVKILL